MHKPAALSSLRSDVPADVDRIIMSSLEIDPNDRPNSVAEWIAELESAAEDINENKRSGGSRLVVMAPNGSEVYVNDERKASVGSSGRVVLTDIPVGQHILRVSKAGERDDERLIEIQAGGNEQVIQAQLRTLHGSSSQPSSSQGTSSSGSPASSLMPGIVACSNCNSRFAEGVKFCGRCGGGSFVMVSAGETQSSFPCPRCSARLPEHSRFCGRCGLNITPAMVPASRPAVGFTSQFQPSNPPRAERLCSRCGGAYPAHIKFCGRCGISL